MRKGVVCQHPRNGGAAWRGLKTWPGAGGHITEHTKGDIEKHQHVLYARLFALSEVGNCPAAGLGFFVLWFS